MVELQRIGGDGIYRFTARAPGSPLMWAQSRARQAEGFRDAHSLQSFPSKVLPYENLRPPLSIFPVLKVEML